MALALPFANVSALAPCGDVTSTEIAVALPFTAVVAMIAAALVNQLWPRSRLWILGGPLLAAAISAPGTYLLLIMCAGRMAVEETGVIVWPPVAACAMVGAGAGIVSAMAIGLMRVGGRRRRRLR